MAMADALTAAAGALVTPAALASSDRVASRVTALFLHSSQANANNDICVT
jgi:hypothetical protein